MKYTRAVRLLSIVLSFLIVVGITAISRENVSADPAAESTMSVLDRILIYSWNDEFKNNLDRYYVEDHPGFVYSYQVIENTTYQTQLDAVLASGDGAPDIFLLEADYAKKYVNSDNSLDINELGIGYAELADQYAYTYEDMRDSSGDIKALTWQVCPSGIFYNRSLATAYLGSDNPEVVQESFATWDAFMAMAQQINTASGGTVKAISGYDEIWRSFNSSRSTGWVVDGAIHMDPMMYTYLDYTKQLTDKNLTFETTQWGDEWRANQENSSVLSYWGPMWLAQYCMGFNYSEDGAIADGANPTTGDWGFCAAPESSYWGGTWLAASKYNDQIETTADIMRYFTIDDASMSQLAAGGEFVNNKSVMTAVGEDPDFELAILGGQNPFGQMNDIARDIDASVVADDEAVINQIFANIVAEYAHGDIETIPEAKAEFISDCVDSEIVEHTSSGLTYTISGGVATITGFTAPTGFDGVLAITNTFEGASVTSIRMGAFAGCVGLTNITIPSSVTSIGESVFEGCTSLTSINVAAANTTYKSMGGILFSEDGNILICCPGGKSGNITIPSSVTSIGTCAFEKCESLTSVKIPSSVSSIGDRAFEYSDSLSDAYFYGNAPTLGESVFDNCAADFSVHYLSMSTGYTNPWYGYPAASFAGGIAYQTHVQDVGWQDYVRDGAVSGTSAQSKRLEGIRIRLENIGISGSIEYRTQVQDIGWMDWVANDTMSGTSGQSKRLEAIQIRLTGTAAALYDVYYRVHAQNTGWMDWAKNGESSGTAGYSYRLEAIEIKLVTKGDAAPGSTTRPYLDCNAPKPVVDTVSYKTHVQDIGWQAYVSNGEASGTSGQSKRLEAIQMKLKNMAGGIEYRTHVQDYGWMGWVANNTLSGTSGQSKRLEAIQIRLTGAAADEYDIYYCVHAQNTGWLDWAKNGESAGTAGFGYRLEAIKVVLVPKGGAAPGATDRPFVQG